MCKLGSPRCDCNCDSKLKCQYKPYIINLMEGLCSYIGCLYAIASKFPILLSLDIQALAEQGKNGFYTGRVAEAIVQCVQSHGGVMTLSDLKQHCSTHDQPLKTSYRGVDVWEMPPNGQGIAALMALNILEEFDIASELNTFSVCV